ncbi:MAG: peptidoglycan-binding protein [Hyphomonas sp.]|nr:peptidoglycan-binding protein [Hyphomonas sp.]
MKRLLALTLASTAIAGLALAQGSADYPPESDAGSCFARVLIPESTEIQTEQVVDRPESTEIKIIPATYEMVSEQVMIKEASTVYTIMPAVFETVTEQVVETPERTETSVIPAEYETYSEQVLVRPAYTTWKPGNGLFGRTASADGNVGVATGEVLCRVEVPAQYDTVTRTRLKTAERTETNVIPASFRTISREVVKTPAQVIEETVPAEFTTITVQKMVTPAREETIVIPATYKTVEKRVVTGGGGLEWREVLCDTNASVQKIREVQQALSDKGYSVPVDGDFGPATLRAMEEYQRANGLPIGYLTVSTVESLGVSPR